MSDQLHKQFEKSIAALGFDMTREGTGYANQRTDDTWRGYKCALSQPSVGELAIAETMKSVDGDFPMAVEEYQLYAQAILERYHVIGKE